MQRIPLIIAIIVSALFTPSFALSETIEELVNRDGVYFKKFSDTPFSGKVIGKTQGILKGGKWDSKVLFFHPNGQLRQKGIFKNGRKVGLWVTYFESGRLHSKGHYNDDKRNGLWEAYFSSYYSFSKQRSRPDLQVRYKDGVIVGKCQVFPGKSGFCSVNWGLRTGGIVRKGLWVDLFENGNVRSKGEYNSGKKEGLWVNHFEKGNIQSKGEFESGKETGLWENYFENGQLKSRGRYFKGLKIGPWEGYYDNGKVKYKGSYYDRNTIEKLINYDRFKCSLNDDCKLGVWIEFHKNGDVKTEQEYTKIPDVKG